MNSNKSEIYHDLAILASKAPKTLNFYEKQICNNDYIHKIVLYNSETGKYFQPKCKSYSCPKHGFIMRNRLAKGIEKWLEGQKIIRFWTFTARYDYSKPIKQQNEAFTKAWKYFITELRRNKILSNKERKLDYVKVYEVHKRGGLHIHLFSTEFIHWTKLQTLWEKALLGYFPKSSKLGNVHTKRNLSPKNSGLYIAKYVTKLALQTEVKIRSWSKSGKVSIFAKRIRTGKWYLIRKDSVEYLHLQMGIPILVQITPHVTKAEKKKRLFPPQLKLFHDVFNWELQRFFISSITM